MNAGIPIRRSILAATFILAFVAELGSQRGPAPPIRVSGPDPVFYAETRPAPSTFRDRGTSYAPTYLIYANKQRTAEDGKALVDELGMLPHLDEYKARAFVAGPMNGMEYDPVADLDAFKNFLRTRRSSNLKLIGIGAGATFINNVLAQYAFAVAGILTYGGTLRPGTTTAIPVPAYVHATDGSIARFFRQANGATDKSDETAFYTTYVNRAPYRSQQRVVVSKLSDAREGLAQAFQNAWNTVFSRNYRLYMSRIERRSIRCHDGPDPALRRYRTAPRCAAKARRRPRRSPESEPGAHVEVHRVRAGRHALHVGRFDVQHLCAGGDDRSDPAHEAGRLGAREAAR